jgi:hypothetical protein
MKEINKFQCPVCGAGDSGWGIGLAGKDGPREYPGTVYASGFQESRLFITYCCGSQYIIHNRIDGIEFEKRRDCQTEFNPIMGLAIPIRT